MELLTATKSVCFHCGDDCPQNPVLYQHKSFCCDGCKTVYRLLEENDLCTYYDLDKNPGFKIKVLPKQRFAYLEEDSIVDKLLDFNEGNVAGIRLYIPRIHCSSCIWLLENLYKLRKGILSSQVNFPKKEITIRYHKSEITLRMIVEILDSFGYTPSIQLQNYSRKKASPEDRSLYYRIGIAGFCAGNIMMLSFPEYLGIEETAVSLKKTFGYLNMVLSLPVVLYGASDYFQSAYAGLKNKILNLDVPIALGTTAVFLRSIYEVLTGTGAGYFDSLTGLIFFLLIGKWIQTKTYQKFAFERDYESYFPVAITKLEQGTEKPVPVMDLKKGDEILVRNNEIIPTDALLIAGKGYIDYSFVSGESIPVSKKEGDVLYAGGKQTGNSIHLEVMKDFSQSYFLQLWKKEVFNHGSNAYLSSFVLSFGKYFTVGTLLIAGLTFLYWYLNDPSKALFSVTSVLLVACPCSLALALPFALSNCLRLLSKKGIYLKNADTVESLSEIDTIVFDKTGTLTEVDSAELIYFGKQLSPIDLRCIRSAVRQSSHPLSRALYSSMRSEVLDPDFFEEIPSEGIRCLIKEKEIKVGSAGFVGIREEAASNESRVYIAVDQQIKGYYKINNQYRKGIKESLTQLKSKGYEMHVLSGDNAGEADRLRPLFGNNMKFGQTPQDKLEYIETLKYSGKKVLMLGDGLNDAGALKAATVGIAVSDNVYNFFPASDGILEGTKINRLISFLNFSRMGIGVIKASLVLSLFYNAAGLFFAVQGSLSPLIAAILMPLSSVTVVLFVVVATSIRGKQLLKF